MTIEQLAKLNYVELNAHLKGLSYIELSQLRHQIYRAKDKSTYSDVARALKFLMNTPLSNSQLTRLFDMRRSGELLTANNRTV